MSTVTEVRPDTNVPANRWGGDIVVTTILIIGAAICPMILQSYGGPFWLDLISKTLIFAIAASSLNLLVGMAGLVSFGHAVFIGIGAYAVGIAASTGIENGFAHLAIVIAACGCFGLLSGMLTLRTRGAHFIMLTMAFSQMVYFVMVGLRQFGGDDGLTIDNRSMFPAPFDIENKITFYYACFAVLVATIIVAFVIRRSRFGLVLMGASGNERRVRSEGFDPFLYQLVIFILAGIICGIAGFLQANLATFVTPSLMNWTASGELLFMVILGGVGTVAGPIIGALAFILIHELLGSVTIYWALYFGLGLVAVALYGRGGLMGPIMQRWPQ